MASIHGQFADGSPFHICGLPDGEGEAIVHGRRWRWSFVNSPGGGPLFEVAGGPRKGEPLTHQNPPRAVWDAFERWLTAWRRERRQ